jgi:hypothetical protein
MSSAVFALEIKPLKGDKISPKSQSVIFGRLRIVSAVPKFNPMGNQFVIDLFDLNSDKPLKDFRIAIKNKYHFKSDGAKGYDIPFYAEAEEGEYMFRKFEYHFDRVNMGDISVKWSGGGGFLLGINGYLSKWCSIPPGSLVYMGVIEIQFNEISDGDLRIDADTSISFDDYEKDLSNFQTTYPKLHEQFKDNVMKVRWVDL